jgi:hypothetical protein
MAVFKQQFNIRKQSMKSNTVSVASAILLTLTLSTSVIAAPKITGTPHIVTPETLLDWPSDFPGTIPDLTEPTANRLNDLHGQVGQCDIVLSTAGNYHMALRELWQHYLSENAQTLDIKTWYYTTSAPISPKQIRNRTVQFGNLNMNCVPQVAVGPGKLMQKLAKQKVTDGKPVKIFKNYGNVLFVKKGNPKNIKSVWDLGRPDVTLVTSNPKFEAGSLGNFASSIYEIAKHDPNPPPGMTADKLFDSIFNSKQDNCGVSGNKCKWVSGKRIMHREQPWAVNAGKADAGIIFYHLALYFTRTFPDKFEIVPLGGDVQHPQPLKGNKVAVLQAVRIKGGWSAKQLGAQNSLMEALQSETFTEILQKHGLRRP